MNPILFHYCHSGNTGCRGQMTAQAFLAQQLAMACRPFLGALVPPGHTVSGLGKREKTPEMLAPKRSAEWHNGEGTDRRIGFFTDAGLPRNGGAAGAVRDTHTVRLDAANACS